MDLPLPCARIRSMTTRLPVAAVLVAALWTSSAGADGLPVVGVEAPPGGVGGEVRYAALPEQRSTFVERTESRTGTLLGSRILRGRFEVPVVAYDGSAGGLSANGKTLVLITPRPRFPRAKTTFALLDAPSLKLRKTLTLSGDYSFDALSPDGRWLYVIHYTAPKDPLQYEVLVMDLRTGRLEPKPIVDKREPDEKMNGHPVTRATSDDGRWAYTLYEGAEHPFVHALDTSRRNARCIDLDWLSGHKGLPELRFALRDEGRELAVRTRRGEALAVVDTETFEASRPQAAGLGSWTKAGVASLALLLAVAGLIYIIRARLRTAKAASSSSTS
jgi:hypothetical protein